MLLFSGMGYRFFAFAHKNYTPYLSSQRHMYHLYGNPIGLTDRILKLFFITIEMAAYIWNGYNTDNIKSSCTKTHSQNKIDNDNYIYLRHKASIIPILSIHLLITVYLCAFENIVELQWADIFSMCFISQIFLLKCSFLDTALSYQMNLYM